MSVYKAIYHKIRLSYIQNSMIDYYIKKEDLEYYLQSYNPSGTPKAFIEMISKEEPELITKDIIECYKERFGKNSAWFPTMEKELYEIIRSLMSTGSKRIDTNMTEGEIGNLCLLFDEIGIFNHNEGGSSFYFDLNIPVSSS